MDAEAVCSHCDYSTFYLIPALEGPGVWAQCEGCARLYGHDARRGLAHPDLLRQCRHCAECTGYPLFTLRPTQAPAHSWAICDRCEHVYGLVASARAAPEGAASE